MKLNHPAMCHFALTAREAGLLGTWTETPPEDLGKLPSRTEYTATWE